MSAYDHWKTTNPGDEFLGPEPYGMDEYEFEDREQVRSMGRMMDDEEQRAEAQGFDSAESYREATPEWLQKLHAEDEDGYGGE